MSVRRIFAEKKEPYAVKAQELMEEMSSYLDIHDAKKVRVLIRYDVENLSDETYEKSKGTIFRSRRSMIFMRAPSLTRRMILFFQ